MFFYWLFLVIWSFAGGMFCSIWLDVGDNVRPEDMNKGQRRLFWLLAGPVAWFVYNICRPTVNFISILLIEAGKYMNRKGD